MPSQNIESNFRSGQLFDADYTYLPDPFEGETLFGWCSRFHRFSGNASARLTSRQLFHDSIAGLRHDFPSCLETFCRNTNDLLGTFDKIIFHRTPFAIFAPFLPPFTTQTIIQKMSKSGTSRVKYHLGLLPSRAGTGAPLKACPSCMRADAVSSVTAWWHIEHQWPTVRVCPRHGDYLLMATHLGLPLIRIRDVGQVFTGTYFDGDYRDEFVVTRGDYLISMDGEFRVAKWLNGNALLNQRVSRLIFLGSELAQRFIAEALQARLRELQGVKAYTTVDHLSGGQISNSVIALPPVSEQHRIVAKVDELMALCDQLKTRHNNAAEAHEKLVRHLLATLTQSQNAADFSANWQRIAAHFDTLFTTEASIDALTQSLLQLAVMGKLVPQDPNDEPASALLKRIQAEKAKLIAEGKIKKDKPLTAITDDEKPVELPQGWEWVRFSEYALDIATGPFGSMIHQSDYVQGGVPLINPSHMIDDKIIADETISVSMAMAKTLDSYAIYEGDIVMARRGEVGRIALVTKRENGWLCGTGSFALRFCPEVCRDYLRIFFRCDYVRTYLAGEAVGTTMVNLNHGILKKMPFGLPPLSEQHRIVAKVDELMALCNQLKTRITQASQLQQKLADVVVEQAVA